MNKKLAILLNDIYGKTSYLMDICRIFNLILFEVYLHKIYIWSPDYENMQGD